MVSLGIDLGTTNCTVSRPRANGGLYTVGPVPSVCAIRNDGILIGEDARELLRSDDPDVQPLRDIKLQLGDYRSDREQSIRYATALLVHLKERSAGKERIDEVVIGTPIRFSRERREALREAARLAGFGRIRLVYEPSSALVGAMEGESLPESGLVLVVDWGGGTLDITVIRVHGGLIQEMEVDGDIDNLGGTCIDAEITRRLLARYPDARTQVERIRGGFDRIKEEIEQDKIEILEREDGDTESVLIAPEWLDDDQLDDILELDPTMVRGVLGEFGEKAAAMIGKMLERAGIRTDHITHLLLAGGTCRSPIIQQAITRNFPDATVLEHDSPQLLTGIGCGRLLQQGFHVQLASDVALRQCDDLLCVLLRRGQSVELGAYREAELMVTDPQAHEAVLDLGVCHFDGESRSLMAADASSFRSLEQLFVRVSSSDLRREAGDLVRLSIGVDHNLTVVCNALSQRTRDTARIAISGIPLAISLGGEERRHV